MSENEFEIPIAVDVKIEKYDSKSSTCYDKPFELPRFDSNLWWQQTIMILFFDVPKNSCIDHRMLTFKANDDFRRFRQILASDWNVLMPNKKDVPRNDAAFRVVKTTLSEIIKNGSFNEWKIKLYVDRKERWRLKNLNIPDEQLSTAKLLDDFISKKLQSQLNRNPLAFCKNIFHDAW